MIRVLLERILVEGMEEPFDQVLREVRQSAVAFPGYISGESLKNADDPHHYVVISTWRSRQEWDAWAHSDERGAAQARIAPCLHEAEKITIFEPV